MNPEEFNQLVSADVRWIDPATASPERPVKNNITDAQRQWLRQPENLDEWYDELTRMLRKIDSQQSSRRAERYTKRLQFEDMGPKGRRKWLEYVAAEEQWRSGSLRFKRGVEDRLVECKALKRQRTPIQKTDEQIEIIRLRTAIAAHKQAFDMEDASPEDRELWRTIGA